MNKFICIAILAGLMAGCHIKPDPNLPVGILAVKACGQLKGVIVVTQDGYLHSNPTPMSAEQQQKILDVAKSLPKTSLGTLDICSQASPEGETTS